MAKYGSASFDVLLADGYDLLAAKVQSINHKVESITEPSHGLGDGNESNTPVGMTRATLSQDGAFFEDGANGMHVALKAASNVSRILCFAFMDNTFGRSFTGCRGETVVSYEVLTKLAALHKANAGYIVSGINETGIIVQPWTQKTITWNTFTDGFPVDFTLDTGSRVIPITSNSLANPTVVTTPVPHGRTTGDVILVSGVATSTPTINGAQTVTVTGLNTFTLPINVTIAGTGGSFVPASSPAGGAAYLQVSEMTGITGFIGKIRGSTDNVTYADLATFVNVAAAPAAQVVLVAGVIPRYLSFSGTVTGAGTITVFAGIARN
jgi:hypothetical protein